jgi:hypothetical protein
MDAGNRYFLCAALGAAAAALGAAAAALGAAAAAALTRLGQSHTTAKCYNFSMS